LKALSSFSFFVSSKTALKKSLLVTGLPPFFSR
jgi:hypothetical protein